MKGVAVIVPRSLSRMLMAMDGVTRETSQALVTNIVKNMNLNIRKRGKYES